MEHDPDLYHYDYLSFSTSIQKDSNFLQMKNATSLGLI